VLAPALAARARRPVVFVTAFSAACVWTADLLATGLKALADRPRPFEVLPHADPLMHGTVGASFPSGHAATSFAGAVCLGVLTRRAIPALAVLAVTIAFSRVYVGVHYPFDVLAGALLGTTVALAALALGATAPRRLSALRRRSARAPPPG
jgi:undecaprenyl-diphosphatase